MLLYCNGKHIHYVIYVLIYIYIYSQIFGYKSTQGTAQITFSFFTKIIHTCLNCTNIFVAICHLIPISMIRKASWADAKNVSENSF